MKQLGSIMFKGLVTMLPTWLTFYILFWLVSSAETVLGGMFKVLLPGGWYIPGMSLLAGLAATFMFGLPLNAFLVRRLLDLGEKLMDSIPLIKTFYGSLKDFIGFFANKRDNNFKQVVTMDPEFGGKPSVLVQECPDVST